LNVKLDKIPPTHTKIITDTQVIYSK